MITKNKNVTFVLTDTQPLRYISMFLVWGTPGSDEVQEPGQRKEEQQAGHLPAHPHLLIPQRSNPFYIPKDK